MCELSLPLQRVMAYLPRELWEGRNEGTAHICALLVNFVGREDVDVVQEEDSLRLILEDCSWKWLLQIGEGGCRAQFAGFARLDWLLQLSFEACYADLIASGRGC